jgi:quercetin dioxygenase-like cupin family protein
MSPVDPDLDALLDGLGFLDEPAPRPAPPRPRAHLLAHLSGRAPFVGFAPRLARLFQLPEARAEELLLDLGKTPPWEPFLPVASLLHFTPGPALQKPGVDAGFVRFAAGTTFPQHAHGGDEVTLVLQGGFVDPVTGRHLRPGDTLLLPAGTSHAFPIDPGEPCLAAVLLMGPITFP